MEMIEATYRVTTPMFLGGAEQQAELRLPSFKGVLRFWWRASVWPRIAAQGGSVKTLHDQEADLFGSSHEKVGQSKISLRLMDSGVPQVIPKGAQLKDGNVVVGQGARYLGYGVMEAFTRRDRRTNQIKALEGELTRSCLEAPFQFTVAIALRPGLTELQRQDLVGAVQVVGLCGGLGSKSRKGYGSLTLVGLKGTNHPVSWEAPSRAADFVEAVRTLFGAARLPGTSLERLPPLTAFSDHARVLAVGGAPRDTPLALMDRLGREMIRYRSWGKNGRVLGNVAREADFKFKADHELMVVQRHPRNRHPARIVFGLPHNYGKAEDHKEVEPADPHLDRRASPLFVHVHQTSSQPPVGVLIFLPAEFLPPQRSHISVGGSRVPLLRDGLWKPVDDFLNRLLDPARRKEHFDSVLEVTHA